jgi:hypothetical protein
LGLHDGSTHQRHKRRSELGYVELDVGHAVIPYPPIASNVSAARLDGWRYELGGVHETYAVSVRRTGAAGEREREGGYVAAHRKGEVCCGAHRSLAAASTTGSMELQQTSTETCGASCASDASTVMRYR